MQTKWICAVSLPHVFERVRDRVQPSAYFFTPVNCLFSEWVPINGFSFFPSLCAPFTTRLHVFFVNGQIARSHIEWKTHHIYRFWMFQIYGIRIQHTIYIYVKYISTCNTHRKRKQFFCSLSLSLSSSLFGLFLFNFPFFCCCSRYFPVCCHSCCFHFSTEGYKARLAVQHKRSFIRPCRAFIGKNRSNFFESDFKISHWLQ